MTPNRPVCLRLRRLALVGPILCVVGLLRVDRNDGNVRPVLDPVRVC